MKHFYMLHALRFLKLKFVFTLLLCWGFSIVYSQEGDPFAERDSEPIRLNLLRAGVISPNGQALPYEWSAAYLRNAFGKQGESLPAYQQDSSLCGVGVFNSSDFEERTKIFYTYEEGGKIAGIRFEQKQLDGSFQDYSRKLFEYDDNRQIRYLYQLWDGEWKNDYEERTFYDSEGQPNGVVTREMNESGEWALLDSVSIRFDTEGNAEETLGFVWEESDWIPVSRQLGTFNDEGNYTEFLQQEWNGVSFDTRIRERASYGPSGQRWLRYQLDISITETDTLRPFLRERYEYDAFGYWKNTTLQIADSLTGEFENQARESYQFTRKGIWTGWLQQLWEDDEWVNAQRQRFEGNRSDRQLIVDQYESETDSWVPILRNITRFDEQENLVLEAGSQVYDPFSEVWFNLPMARKCEHSWSPANLSTANQADILSTGLDCVFANPYSLYSPISCNAMEPGKLYDLSLVNMEGKRVLHKKISGGSTFSLDRDMSTGLYHMSIRESGLVRHLQKVIITKQ